MAKFKLFNKSGIPQTISRDISVSVGKRSTDFYEVDEDDPMLPDLRRSFKNYTDGPTPPSPSRMRVAIRANGTRLRLSAEARPPQR